MTRPEEWREIPDTGGRYEISSTGLIRRWDKKGPSVFRGCRVKFGYVVVSINGCRKLRHVVVASAFHGPPKPGQVCRHLNGVAGDDRPENLAWGSMVENAQDSIQHGTNYALRKTHCKWGHEFTAANTFISNVGQRICRTCKAKRGRKGDEKIARQRRERRVAARLARPDRCVIGVLPDGSELVSYRKPGLCYFREWPLGAERDRAALSAADLRQLVATQTAAAA